ncbi:hypothetical protein RSOLAG1IB_09454 [Rhizoctonia solani AG-1 IB]|uniref:Uncharacterized protein n=1 Tax=Thanatephorus cucumeris (strain AG1-IB / isolate 7/3/14) TaxID=1108050 RepID=A0A0B7FQG6_THACB|nr:hypothetical protein RSOLAG1IB_09454 [Rhizoctonia solani AG-1 IB]
MVACTWKINANEKVFNLPWSLAEFVLKRSSIVLGNKFRPLALDDLGRVKNSGPNRARSTASTCCGNWLE